MNMPTYRAKKIDSDEYIEGDLFARKFIITISILNKKILSAIKHIEEDVLSCNINENCKNEHIELKDMLTKLIYNERLEHITEIDPTTLAIHFPDMLDSQGNKIFASLSASGKGGDIMNDDEYYGIAKYLDCKFVVEYENCFDVIDEGNFEIIGIQE